MLNFIFQQRNNYGLANRKINQLLEQEGGCTLEDLLQEDEFCVQQCKQSNPKLLDYLCQKANLIKLIQFATLIPADESHTVAHKYPFVAMDILCSCKQIAQAICEGGWNTKPENETEDDDESEEKSENKMVRDILNKNDKDEKKETLVEELNLTEEGKEGKNAINSEAPETQQKNDWSLMDQLFNNFLATPQDQMLSVLCGYFNKIVQSLLVKENSKTLEYLLLRRNGGIFDGLMRHMSHHSLAILLIELLQVQIKPEDSKSKKISMYNSDGSDNENDDDEKEEAVLTADQQKMQECLAKKGQQIIMQLLDSLSEKNPDDLERTLNAFTVLMEFCENDHCFNLLTHYDVLKRLIAICCQGMMNPMNLRYSMNLLTTIIQEFSNTDKEIAENRKTQIQQLFAQHFADISYNCIMVLHVQHPGEAEYQNQTDKKIAKIGLTRLRSIELLKILFVTVQKMGREGKAIVSPLLRAKVIDSMLHMIKTYPFASLNHSQCITILSAMKENFDQDDLNRLKKFVLVELEGQSKFHFISGRACSGPNMGQITQIAFELRSLTQQQLNEESSDDEAHDVDRDAETLAEVKLKRKNMAKWLKFCKNKIEKIEKVWNRKLEDPREDDDTDSPAPSDSEEDTNKDSFNQFDGAADHMSRSFADASRSNEDSDAIKKAMVDSAAYSKDDSELVAHIPEMGHNQYWKLDSQHDLNDLLSDFE